MDFELWPEKGSHTSGTLNFGDLIHIPLEGNAKFKAAPAKGFDMGAGRGKPIEAKIEGGMVGVVLDGRGRPMELPKDKNKRRKMLLQWNKVMDLYPS